MFYWCGVRHVRFKNRYLVRVCARVSLGPRVGIIVRVRISVMVRVSTTHNFKHNH